MNNIFLSYKESTSCFLNNIQGIEVIPGSSYFQSTSLDLNFELLNESIITKFTSVPDQGEFVFFEIPSLEFGLLGKMNFIEEPSIQKVHPLHLELYYSFGSIIDSYSINKEKNTHPYIDVFSVNNNSCGLGSLEEDYIEKCKESNLMPITNLVNLTTLAVEANGNLIQYDERGEIYFYLADHIPNDDKFIQLENVPPDTFYFSNEIKSLRDWVENYFKQIVK